jgi:hypothetical protein
VDGNGQARWPFADVFHLQPDRGLEFFAFLLASSSVHHWFEAGSWTTAFGYPRRPMFEERA